ncbi:MAG: FecR domain-containing protein [Bacteroidia bacterium]
MASADSTRSLVLPDSSTIILNKNSQIAYSIDHFSGKRVVKLKGEAFFNVIHDEKNPFMVEAADLKIQDIGTSFNVRAEEGEDLIVVSVISGEVSLTTINNESITLHRCEEAHYHLSTRKFEQDTELDPNISAYTNRIFVFDNAELSTVIRTLNDVYSNKFSIDNDVLKSCRITVTFDDETPESIASVITETLGIQYKKENNQIIFFGNGCK